MFTYPSAPGFIVFALLCSVASAIAAEPSFYGRHEYGPTPCNSTSAQALIAADFNGDGRVTIVDFNLLKTNFGLAGSDPIGPRRETDE